MEFDGIKPPSPERNYISFDGRRSRKAPRRLRENQMMRSFRPPFSKGGAIQGAEPSSRSAEREISRTPFLFAKLFLCGFSPKEKAERRSSTS
ncbi:MAG: hypothetical protein ACI3XI_06665 [Eubacteriales bacterium]